MKYLTIIFVCLVVVILSWFIPPPADKVVFLDVGQGDSILIQEGTKQVLVDGGQGRTVLTRLGEELSWFDRRLEVVIATHPDRDHLEGLLHVLEHYEVGLVLLPYMPHETDLQRAWLTQLEELLQRQQIAYRFAWAGQQLTLSSAVRLQMLAPFAEDGTIVATGGKTNNGAVLTRLAFHDRSFLLTADAEAAVENLLIAREKPLLDVDVLKAGHHGSKTSTSQALLDAASPAAVVISVGKDNRYGHPHPTVVARLASLPVFRTDEHGSIRFAYHDERWLLQP